MAKERARRSTREEMIQKTREKLEKLLAQQEGSYQEDSGSESFQIKQIRKGLRRRKTLLHRAEVVLNGKPPTATAPGGKTIDQQIARLEAQLEDKRQTRENALVQVAKLPFDIEALERIVNDYDTAENAEERDAVDVSWPDLEVRVDTDPTETEVEADAGLEPAFDEES